MSEETKGERMMSEIVAWTQMCVGDVIERVKNASGDGTRKGWERESRIMMMQVEEEARMKLRTVESLFVKWTIQPSLSTFEPLLFVCFTLWTILIKGMLLEESISLQFEEKE